jgi:formylglycine-generating enzyme
LGRLKTKKRVKRTSSFPVIAAFFHKLHELFYRHRIFPHSKRLSQFDLVLSFIVFPSQKTQGGDKHPVLYVSHDDAVAHTAWLSEQTGKTYGLPTEEQWEYACRAGTTTPSHFGDYVTTEQANYDGRYPYGDNQKGENRGTTIPVGRFPANAFGLHDMLGNVWEWCLDQREDQEEERKQKFNGRSGGASCVIRGGGWRCGALSMRSANRAYISRKNQCNVLGYRVMRKVP